MKTCWYAFLLQIQIIRIKAVILIFLQTTEFKTNFLKKVIYLIPHFWNFVIFPQSCPHSTLFSWTAALIHQIPPSNLPDSPIRSYHPFQNTLGVPALPLPSQPTGTLGRDKKTWILGKQCSWVFLWETSYALSLFIRALKFVSSVLSMVPKWVLPQKPSTPNKFISVCFLVLF